MQADLAGRHAVITGGGTGMGRALSRALARCGATVSRKSETNRKSRMAQTCGIVALLLTALVLGCKTESTTGRLTLARDGKTDYCIVISTNASTTEKAAATELAKYLKEISGAAFPIQQDSQPRQAKEIILGKAATLDLSKLGQEGFCIRTSGETLLISGGSRAGTINGVYEFLAKHLGCRWYALDCTVVPRQEKLTLGAIEYSYSPPFLYRRHGWHSDQFPDWAAPNHVNAFMDAAIESSMKDPRLADSWWYPQNAAVHTLTEKLCNVNKHFEKHPEYFAEVNGQRVRADTQLCISNPDVLLVVVEDARKLLAGDPRAKRISISAADWANYCQCGDCKKLADKFGGVAASYIEFANRCAVEIGKTHPDVTVEILIYRWQRCLPPPIQYAANLCVQFAPIENCIFHALDECEYNVRTERFVEELQAWAKGAPHLSVWFYTDSAEYITPYPVLRAMGRNFRFIRDVGADGVFVEGHTRNADSQLGALTSYLVAQLSWNPDYDVQRGIEEFTETYYGAAAPEIREYVAAVNDGRTYTQTNATRLRSFPGFHAAMQNPQFLDLRDEVITRLTELFDAAEKKVANDAVLLRRVRVARMPLQVKILDQLAVSDPLWQRTQKDFWAFLPGTDVNTIKYISVAEYRAEIAKKVKQAVPLPKLPQGKELAQVAEMWSFRTDPEKAGEREKWFAPGVKPGSWKEISTHKYWDYAVDRAPYEGDGWYTLDLTIPSANGKKVWLIFGTVDENYTLWVNGQYVADNLDMGTTMYDKPVAVEITKQCKPGEKNHLAVRVKNTIGAGGICKPVRLIAED